MAFKVMSRRCDQCLMDADNRIVPASRAGDLLRQCKEQDIPFLCHKGSMEGLEIACRGHHDAAPCRMARFGQWLGAAPVEIDPDTLLPTESVRPTTNQAASAADAARLAPGRTPPNKGQNYE